MTREEAIARLEANRGAFVFKETNEALDMAIEALHREEAEAKGYCHRIRPKEYFSVDANTYTRITGLLPDAVSRESYINAVGYVEWLEKLIVDSETFEWVCEDTDREWCEKNCHYSSIQAECLRHLYEVSKGGDSDAEPKWNCTANFVAEQLEKLKNMTDEERLKLLHTVFPSVDAVHGEWVRKYDDKINCYWYECDQCGEYRPRNQFGKEYNANFCPNCGARMKGGDTE